MRHETYTCNLCGEKQDKSDLFTLFSDSIKGWQVIPYRNMNWDGADRHVCKECVRIIKEQVK